MTISKVFCSGRGMEPYSGVLSVSGGSATNDGGVGMLQALGFGFLHKETNPDRFGAKGLAGTLGIRSETSCNCISSDTKADILIATPTDIPTV